jgi:ATP-dependent exoDNAse (exonuclease V) beta subunit
MEDGYRVYETPDGNSYQSVTTLLSAVSRKDINEWRNAVGIEAADKLSKYSATRGSNFHAYIEKYLKNEEFVLDKKRVVDVYLFKSFRSTLARINRIHLLEAPLYSHTLRLAGTVDCVAQFDRIDSVIDFKSSRKRKDRSEIDSYFLQTAIYSYMIEELYRVRLKQLVVLIGVEFEKPQVFVEQRSVWKDRVFKLLNERYKYEKATPSTTLGI